MYCTCKWVSTKGSASRCCAASRGPVAVGTGERVYRICLGHVSRGPAPGSWHIAIAPCVPAKHIIMLFQFRDCLFSSFWSLNPNGGKEGLSEQHHILTTMTSFCSHGTSFCSYWFNWTSFCSHWNSLCSCWTSFCSHWTSFCSYWSPWYNHTGWLGVKHQLTYQQTVSTEPLSVPIEPLSVPVEPLFPLNLILFLLNLFRFPLNLSLFPLNLSLFPLNLSLFPLNLSVFLLKVDVYASGRPTKCP